MSRSRGFTLIETMIVVALIAIGVGVAAYSLYGGAKRGEVRARSKEVLAALREVRQMSTSGQVMPGLACGAPTCVPRSVGVRFLSRTSFEVFGDVDFAAGGELVVRTFDLSTNRPDNQVQFTTPPDGEVIRFNSTGVLVTPPVSVTLVDQISNETHVITITLAGAVTLDGS